MSVELKLSDNNGKCICYAYNICYTRPKYSTLFSLVPYRKHLEPNLCRECARVSVHVCGVYFRESHTASGMNASFGILCKLNCSL